MAAGTFNYTPANLSKEDPIAAWLYNKAKEAGEYAKRQIKKEIIDPLKEQGKEWIKDYLGRKFGVDNVNIREIGKKILPGGKSGIEKARPSGMGNLSDIIGVNVREIFADKALPGGATNMLPPGPSPIAGLLPPDGGTSANKGVEGALRKLDNTLINQNRAITQLSGKATQISKVSPRVASSGVDKVLKHVGGDRIIKRAGIALGGKAGGRIASKALGTGVGKIASKAVAGAAAKKIPILGAGVGALFALGRLMKGDFVGAAGELASGVASVVPGIGTAASLGIDAALAASDMTGMTGGERQSFRDGATIIPGMTNMPFNLPGLNGVFNEPGNPEVMSIQPLKTAMNMIPGMGGISSLLGAADKLFSGNKKEYKGIAEAIGDELEKRGIGDPLGMKGSKSGYGSTTRDLLKNIFPWLGGSGNNQGGSNNGGGGGTTPSGSTPNMSGDAVQQTAQMLRNSEGFREDPYWDVNAYRAGYGSSTYTTADGQVKTVQQGVKVSREDAERDLQRRITTEFMPKTKNAVGADIWDRMPPSAQAALTSITYNYGSLPSRVSRVVKSTNGDLNAIADAVEALGSDDNGVNMRRRKEEADVIRRSVGQQPAGGQQAQMMQVSDFKEYNLESNDANSVVRMADNALYKTNDKGNITDERVTLGQANEIMRQKNATEASYNSMALTPMSNNTSSAASGQILEYLTGDQGHMGYRADHGGSNYHEHLAFGSKEDRDRAAAALRAEGIQIGSMNDGTHAAGSYHYTDQAFDVPASQVPVGQEPALSRKVRSILSRAGFRGKGIGVGGADFVSMGDRPGSESGMYQTSATSGQPQYDSGAINDFFSFARGMNGSDEGQTSSTPSPNTLLRTSAQTTMAAAKPPTMNLINNSPAVVNNPGGGGAAAPTTSSAAGTFSDAGLMAYSAWQHLLTLGT